MKIVTKIVSSIVLIFIMVSTAYAQVPQGFNFQAVATAPDGTPISNQEIGVEIEVVKGTEEGDIVYTETHVVTTNLAGLFQIVIGEGTPAEANDFSAINWGDDNYFVGFSIDLTNSGAYESLGKTRLLSVPYALLAQDVVNGTGGSAITEYELDVTAGDTAFTVFMTGDEGGAINPALSGYANTVGFNIGVDGISESVAGNETFQYGVRGIAFGEGTGLHYGLRGEARAATAWNVGVRGQSIWENTQENYGGWFSGRNSSLRNVGIIADARDFQGLGVQYNTGVVAIASGPGSGDEENGSYNTGVRAEVDGNTIGNHAISAVAFGEAGVDNAGVFAESNVNDGTTDIENTGVKAFAGGPGRNIGLYGSAFNGVENYAGWFDGEVVINGDLTVNGAVNGEGGGANGSTLDSLFFSTLPEAEFQRSSFFYPGYQRYEDQDGRFAVHNRNVLQYGQYEEGGSSVYSWYNRFGMQVARDGYAAGERATGMAGGYFYMDIFKDGNFYAPFEFGIGNAAEGGRPFFSMSSLDRKENGDGGSFVNINVVQDPNGNDPTGEAGEMFLWGKSTPNIQMGGQQWQDTDHAYIQLFGSTENGNGWYHSNVFMGVGDNGTKEYGFLQFFNTDSENQSSEETINMNGETGDVFINNLNVNNRALLAGNLNDTGAGGFEILDANNALRLFADASNGSFQVKRASDSGTIINMTEFAGGGQLTLVNSSNINFFSADASSSTLELKDENGNTTISFDAAFGNGTFSGSVNQSSDRRLKTNITDLSKALDNTLALRGVSYTWIDENKTQDTQIGVIAQEVEEVYPEFVRTDDEGMKSVNYSQMVAVLIEAVKELNSKIEVLESENSELRAQLDEIDTMKAQINTLMTLISATPEVETVTADK